MPTDLKDYLELRKFKYSSLPNIENAFRVLFETPSAIYSNILHDLEEDKCLLLLSFFPIRISKVNKAILEKIADINYNLLFGNFEINNKTGVLRFRLSIPYLTEKPSVEMIDKMIELSLSIVESHSDMITNVIFPK